MDQVFAKARPFTIIIICYVLYKPYWYNERHSDGFWNIDLIFLRAVETNQGTLFLFLICVCPFGVVFYPILHLVYILVTFL